MQILASFIIRDGHNPATLAYREHRTEMSGKPVFRKVPDGR